MVNVGVGVESVKRTALLVRCVTNDLTGWIEVDFSVAPGARLALRER